MTTTSRARLLILSGRRWDATSAQLALVAAEAHRRGLPLAVAVPDVAAPYWARVLPDVEIRALDSAASVRVHRASVQSIADAVRANVACVDDELVRRLAVRVLGDRGVVLHRLAFSESAPPESFARRLSARRTPTALLLPTLAERLPERTAPDRVPRFAVPMAIAPDAHDEMRGAHPPLAIDVRLDGATPLAPPVLVVVPDATHPLGALPALRAAGRIVKRHADMRIHLLGVPQVTQGLQVQAAALGIAHAVSTGPSVLSTLDVPRGTVAAWIAATGDIGATAVLSAMAQRVPVLLAADSLLAPAVSDHVTGMLLDDADPMSDAIAAGHLARLLSHHDEHHAMGAAARARAQRLYNVQRLMDAVLDVAERLLTRARRAA